ncbi:MAG: alpha/beta fold hydrolase, partial [Opitutales bacterium]
MFPAITRRLDELAIATACRSVRPSCDIVQSKEVVKHPDYFADPVSQTNLEFYAGNMFRFPSPVPSPWEENNFVFGQLHTAHRSPSAAGSGPAVLLLHGWNGEQGYRLLFPLLARRFRQLGLTVAMIELPYHGTRKPKSGPLRNFLSGDIAHMMEATRQAIADIRAMIDWLHTHGYGPLAIWGVSLGAWLGGLVACVEKRLQAAVLLTPVPKLEEAIENLAFCRHIRASMEGRDISAAELNLTA